MEERLTSVKSERPTLGTIDAKVYAAEDDQDFFENRPGLYEVVPKNDAMMQIAAQYGEEYSNNPNPIGCAVVRETVQVDGSIKRETIFLGANFSQYHADNYNPVTNGCKRYDETGKSLYPSGTGYDKCPGCDYHNHAEAQTVKHALEQGLDLRGTKIFMAGHYWGCQPCWRTARDAGVVGMVIAEGAREDYEERKRVRAEKASIPKNPETESA